MSELATIVQILYTLFLVLFILWNARLRHRFNKPDWTFRLGLLWVLVTLGVLLTLWNAGIPRTATFLYYFYAAFGFGSFVCVIGLIQLIRTHKIKQYWGAENYTRIKREVNGS